MAAEAPKPFNTNVERSASEILKDIEHWAARSATHNNPSLVAAPFAALLVRLSNDADRTATKIARLTWALIWLTVALLIFTIFLSSKDIYEFYKDHAVTAQNSGQSDKNHDVSGAVPPRQLTPLNSTPSQGTTANHN